jgi:hypothetical protein
MVVRSSNSLLLTVAHSQTGAACQGNEAVPRQVNFSGKAADAQDKAISGVAGATFSIYKDQYEGEASQGEKSPAGASRQAITAGGYLRLPARPNAFDLACPVSCGLESLVNNSYAERRWIEPRM